MSADNLLAVDSDSFISEVLEAAVPVLVDFWAPWCGPCKALAPTLSAIAKDRGDTIKVVSVDIQANSAVAARYQVMALPTLLVFRHGSPVTSLVRPAGKPEIDNALDQL